MKYNVVDDDYICIKEASFRINHCVIRVSSIFGFFLLSYFFRNNKKAAQGMVSLSRSIFKKCGPQETTLLSMDLKRGKTPISNQLLF